MSKVHDHPEAQGGGRKYGGYQMQVYMKGIVENVFPAVTTDPNKLREQARSRMSLTSFNYIAGGAGESATMDANRLAFRQWKVGYLDRESYHLQLNALDY